MNRIALPLALVLTSSPLLAQSAALVAEQTEAAQSKQPVAAANRQEQREPRVWLGLSLQPRTDGAPRLEVLDVLPDSPASKAQVQDGDVLVALGDKPIKNHDSLVELLRGRHPGERAKLTVERSKPIALGESKEQSHAMLGVVTEEDRRSDSSPKRGLTVSDVSSESAAETAGFVEGDRICAVDGNEIDTGDELIRAIQSHKPGDTVEIRFQRDIEVRFGERPEQAQAPKADGQGLFRPDSKRGDFWGTPPQKQPQESLPRLQPAQPRKPQFPGVPGEQARKRAPAASDFDQNSLAQLLNEIRALRSEVADLRREISKLRPGATERKDAAPRARPQLR